MTYPAPDTNRKKMNSPTLTDPASIAPDMIMVTADYMASLVVFILQTLSDKVLTTAMAIFLPHLSARKGTVKMKMTEPAKNTPWRNQTFSNNDVRPLESLTFIEEIKAVAFDLVARSK